MDEFLPGGTLLICFCNGADPVYLNDVTIIEYNEKKYLQGERLKHPNDYLGGCKQTIRLDYVSGFIKLGDKEPIYEKQGLLQRFMYFLTGNPRY